MKNVISTTLKIVQIFVIFDKTSTSVTLPVTSLQLLVIPNSIGTVCRLTVAKKLN